MESIDADIEYQTLIKRQANTKYVLLNSIEVSRESLGIFTKLIKSMPELEDTASQLIFIEQKNIKDGMEELVNHIRSTDE